MRRNDCPRWTGICRHIEEIYDPTVVSEWIDQHSVVAREALITNQEAVDLLDRICRVMLRQHMIKEHPSDMAGRFLQFPYWRDIEKILFRARLLDRIEGKATSGARASFLRMKDPLNILVRRDDPKIKRIWDEVGNIPVT
jgi:hypothetical protein